MRESGKLFLSTPSAADIKALESESGTQLDDRLCMPGVRSPSNVKALAALASSPSTKIMCDVDPCIEYGSFMRGVDGNAGVCMPLFRATLEVTTPYTKSVSVEWYTATA